MSQSRAKESPEFPGHAPVDAATEHEQLAQVRSVILAPHHEAITDLKAQVVSLQYRQHDLNARVADTSEVLAASVLRATHDGDELGNALKPIVVDKFHEASREDPDTMAEALFPILGPAVRKMIVNIIAPDKNTKFFGYQVEQLFLIDSGTGLPVCHVASATAQTQDADMVSGMLSAIQSFVQDAFKTREFDGLNTLQMGDLSVWIEWGPNAVLAAVVRGAPPQRLRNAIQIQVEKIHHEHGEAIRNYDGDTSKLDSLLPELKTFLDDHDGSLVKRVKNMSARSKRNLAMAAGAFFAVFLWQMNGWSEQAAWDEFIASLGSEPGIVITGQRREDGIYKVFGLRDQLARDPVEMYKTSRNERNVEFHFEPYYSVHSEFIRERAVKLLKPPPSVDVVVANSTLYVSGNASRQWKEGAKPLSSSLLGPTTTIFNVRTREPGR